MPSIEEICYTAGFFDGEGSACIGLHNNYYQAFVDVSNTNRELLYLIQRAIALGDVREKKHNRATHKRQYALIIPKHHMVKFCNMLIPYVKLKKRQLQIIIEFLQTPEDEIVSREMLRLEISELNQRGRKVAN